MNAPAKTWASARDAWTHAERTLPDNATDADMERYWAAWADAMLTSADSLDAIRWKVEEFARGSEDGGFRDDMFAAYSGAILDDIGRFAAGDRDREAWDRAKLLYDARILLGDVDHAIGALSEAETAYARLGPDEDDDGAFHRATDLYDDEFGQPGQDAALALILTPAPDIAAARLKFEVATFWDIRDEELPQPLQSLIADDIERISGVRKGGAE